MKQAFEVANSHGTTLLKDEGRANDYVTKYGGEITRLRSPRTLAEAEQAFIRYKTLVNTKGNLWSDHDAFIQAYIGDGK